ncbi:MAG: PD-(D/E)XK nuclease family protein [Fimbriimonadaceae bacterium]|nr:PD-(D/E)XK nuclease family protein [Chthonomonadaceae bacterium]MCO5295347.1 PD-(D/E)XK nuclease family protein [Fimbriimonadaceae bacterium]
MAKPTLTPSKITTYLACPTRYRWTYVDARGRWYLRAKPTFSFGLSLHKVLERFHEQGAVETVAQVLQSYEENWIEAGFSSAEEMADAYAEGKEILESYVEDVRRTPATSATILIEQTLRMGLGPFELAGRLDRVDEAKGGALEILDYKTLRTEVTEDDVRTDLAMGCYAVLLRARYPGRPIAATLVAMKGGVRATAHFSDAELDALQEDLLRLGEALLSRRFDTVSPRRIPLCGTCEFVPLCAKQATWSDES